MLRMKSHDAVGHEDERSIPVPCCVWLDGFGAASGSDALPNSDDNDTNTAGRRGG